MRRSGILNRHVAEHPQKAPKGAMDFRNAGVGWFFLSEAKNHHEILGFLSFLQLLEVKSAFRSMRRQVQIGVF